MRSFLLSIMVVALCAASAQAAMVMYEDFEDYDEGSIDQLGVANDFGVDIERWVAQRNSSLRGDSGWSNVVTEDGDKCLQLINRDAGGEIDTVYTSMYLGSDNFIDDEGTVYLRYKASSQNDCIFATNSLYPGYITNVYGTAMTGGDGYQGATTYSDQTQLMRLQGGDAPFRARDGSTYRDTSSLASDTWYELWVQLDCANQQTRYYMCEDGGTPTVVDNPAGGEWWGWRNTSSYTIENLKFFMGMDDQTNEDQVYVDTIALDTAAWSTERVDDPGNEPNLPGDANLDGVVNLDDFILLKQNYGVSPAEWGMGDFNDDDVVNLDDFIILKQHYGETAE